MAALTPPSDLVRFDSFGLLEDTRRAVSEFQRQITPAALKAPLPEPSLRPRPREETLSPCSPSTRPQSWWSRAAARVAAQICSGLAASPGKLARPEEPPPRRWYRIHPTTDMRYFVRPDAGFRGRIPGVRVNSFSSEDSSSPQPDRGTDMHPSCPVSSRQKKRRPSLPGEVERRIGLIDSFIGQSENLCQLCFDRPRGVVLLPCRHGGLCDVCLKKAINSRPIHRGGRTCPFCRRFIVEVIKIHGDAVFPGYGYAIKADSYTR